MKQFIELYKLLAIWIFAGSVTTLTACQSNTAALPEPTLTAPIPNWTYLPYADTSSAIYYLDHNATATEQQSPQWQNITLLEQPASQETPRIPQANLSFIVNITIACNTLAYRINHIQIYDKPFGQGQMTNKISGQSIFLPLSDSSLGYTQLFATVCPAAEPQSDFE